MNKSGDVLTDESATYRGSAAGMSVPPSRRTRTVRNPIWCKFTAAVTLTATFDPTAPTLSGKVSQFEGAAVNTDWSVSLRRRPLTKRHRLSVTRRVVASGRSRHMVGNVVWQRRCTSHGNTRRLQRPFLGRPCRRGLRYPEAVIRKGVQKGSLTPSSRKGGGFAALPFPATESRT